MQHEKPVSITAIKILRKSDLADLCTHTKLGVTWDKKVSKQNTQGENEQHRNRELNSFTAAVCQ